MFLVGAIFCNQEETQKNHPIHALMYLFVFSFAFKLKLLYFYCYSLAACNSPILAPHMNYTESSVFQDDAGRSFAGQYISASTSSYPWGPKLGQNVFPISIEFVQVDLLDVYVVHEIEMLQPKFGAEYLAAPERIFIMYSILPDEWFEYRGKNKKQVSFSFSFSSIAR